MKIVHIGHAPLPSGHPDFGRLSSYPGSWVMHLCKAQFAHGCEVELTTIVPGASANYRDCSAGFPVHYLAGPSRFRAATMFHFESKRIGGFVRELKPDIVHAHGTEESHLLSAQTTRLPYVVTAQGMLSQINAVLPPKWLSRERIIEMLERRALSRAKHIIAKSDYVAEWIRRCYPHLTIHRIPNTFDAALLDLQQTTAKIPKSIVFVGTVIPRKGLDTLADALENAPDLDAHTFHLVGDLGDRATPYEQGIIARLRRILGDRLRLHGRVPALEAARLAAQCEVLVAPSLEEMFGNQVIEALLGGTWPVVSSGTAMEENVRRIGAGTVFRKADPADLRRAVSEAIQTIPTWDPSTARAAITAWMGPETVAKQHRDLYQMILRA